MAHENLGLLLDEFGIESFDDFRQRGYRDRSAFLSRISSTAEYKAQHELHELLTNIDHEPGLKMCFAVKRVDEGRWNNVPNDTFARKLALFTTRTVITFPFHDVYYARGADLEALLNLLCTTRPFLKANYITILPSDIQNHELRTKLKRLMPANFRLPRLAAQFEEKRYQTLLPNLYLPRLEQVTSDEILRIRKEEEIEYQKLARHGAQGGFQRAQGRLERDLINNGFDEKKLLDELSEIDQCVRKLENMAQGIQDSIIYGSLWCLVVIAGSAAAGLLLTPAFATPALTVIGAPAVDLFTVIQFILATRKQMKQLPDDDFYLFWKVHHPANLISVRELLMRCAVNLQTALSK